MAVSKNKGTRSAKGNAKTRRPLSQVSKPVTSDVLEVVGESNSKASPGQTLPLATDIIPNTAIEINGDVDSINTVPATHKPLTARSAMSVVVGLVGGSVAGYMAYNGLKTVFINRGYNEDEANQYAIISGVACGLLTFGVLYTIMKKTA